MYHPKVETKKKNKIKKQNKKQKTKKFINLKYSCKKELIMEIEREKERVFTFLCEQNMN